LIITVPIAEAIGTNYFVSNQYTILTLQQI